MDIVRYNREAWNRESLSGESRWCEPIDEQTTQNAQRGEWEIILTPTNTVPKEWFGDLQGKKVLCLASGGGQQAPLLAAAGACVTSFDNSDEQLAKDHLVATRDNLDLTLVQGDMADLSCFDDGEFDLIFHPVSNLFVSNVPVVWQECYRVLATPGRLLAGFMNPDFYLFDHDAIEAGEDPIARFKLPYSDTDNLSLEQIKDKQAQGFALEFGHSLDDQIGAQLQAGFVLADFFEDRWSTGEAGLGDYMAAAMATLAVKADLKF